MPGRLIFQVDANGAIFEQDPNGCILSGQISIINAAYNAYSVRITFANCTGTDAALNGQSFSGLVTLDTQVSPVSVIGGLTGTVNGQSVAADIWPINLDLPGHGRYMADIWPIKQRFFPS